MSTDPGSTGNQNVNPTGPADPTPTPDTRTWQQWILGVGFGIYILAALGLMFYAAAIQKLGTWEALRPFVVAIIAVGIVLMILSFGWNWLKTTQLGERTKNGFAITILLCFVLIILAGVMWIVTLILRDAGLLAFLDSKPVIAIIDSKDRVYKTKSQGTNAKAIRDILDPAYPDRIMPEELVHPGYVQADQVVRLQPALVIIHLSSFYPWGSVAEDGFSLESLKQADLEFCNFVDYMLKKTKARILVYSRGPPTLAELKKLKPAASEVVPETLLAGMERGYTKQQDFLLGLGPRVNFLKLPENVTFDDPVMQTKLKASVESLLKLEAGKAK